MSTVVSVESVRGGDLRTRGLSASLGEYSPPWAHAVHVARASEKKGAPCSCGSWRGVRAWPVVSVLYLPENASESAARCGVKIFLCCSPTRVCVCARPDHGVRVLCVCVFVLAAGKIKDSAATAGPNSAVVLHAHVFARTVKF